MTTKSFFIGMVNEPHTAVRGLTKSTSISKEVFYTEGVTVILLDTQVLTGTVSVQVLLSTRRTVDIVTQSRD